MDPCTGNSQDPQSLHKYLYAHSNPVNNIDPSGKFTIPSLMTTMSNIGTILSITAPVWTPLASQAAWYLMPSQYRRKLENIEKALPDAFLMGGAFNIGGRAFSSGLPFDFSFNLEGLVSPWTGNAAAFASGNVGTSFGGGAHAGASLYAGLAWAKNSANYSGPCATASISFKAVPREIRGKIMNTLHLIASQVTIAEVASGATSDMVKYEVHKLIQKKNNALSQLASSGSSSLTFGLSWWPNGAFSISLGKGLSVGDTGSRFRVGIGWTSEIWPRETGGTRFR